MGEKDVDSTEFPHQRDSCSCCSSQCTVPEFLHGSMAGSGHNRGQHPPRERRSQEDRGLTGVEHITEDEFGADESKKERAERVAQHIAERAGPGSLV